MTTLSINELSKSERLRLGLPDRIGCIKDGSRRAPVQLAGFSSQTPASREQTLPRPWWWREPKTQGGSSS